MGGWDEVRKGGRVGQGEGEREGGRVGGWDKVREGERVGRGEGRREGGRGGSEGG